MAIEKNTSGGRVTSARQSLNLGNMRSAAEGDDAKKKPKAQFWLNIGYTVITKNADTGENESSFVSLAMGIPLDSIDDLPTTMRNRNFGRFRAAQNALKDGFMSQTEDMQPGDEKLLALDESNGLAIQLRRVLDDVADAEDPEENAFITNIFGANKKAA